MDKYSTMTLKPGTTLQGDKYEIRSILGQGGFGITYLAEHGMMNKLVCIKEFFPREYYNRDNDSRNVSLGSNGSAELMDAYRKKFLKEARTIARLEHPNVIAIYDVFEENNTAYYVMEYIEGESLQNTLDRRGALDNSLAKSIITSVCDALRYIHSRNLLHLDIKPANIMVRKADGRVTLIDFGLAKQYDSDGNQTSSTPIGISHGYAPLEQYEAGGGNTFTPATDIYALGATLYSLATGKRAPRASEVMEDGMEKNVASLSPELKRTILAAMQPTRKKRPQDIDAFLRLLGENDATIQSPTPTPTPIVKPAPAVKPTSETKPKGTSVWWKVAAIVLGVITFLFVTLLIIGSQVDDIEFDGSNGAYVDELVEYAFSEVVDIGDDMYIVDAYRTGNVFTVEVIMAEEDIEDYGEEGLRTFQTIISSESSIDDMASSLASEIDSDILVKELMTHGYTFEYDYYDYDGNYMGTATITPEDYAEYL